MTDSFVARAIGFARACLGAMILDPTMVPFVRCILLADDLPLPEHRAIYHVLCKLHDEQRAIDPLLIEAELDPADLQRIGGIAEIVAWCDDVSSTRMAVAYALAVVQSTV